MGDVAIWHDSAQDHVAHCVRIYYNYSIPSAHLCYSFSCIAYFRYWLKFVVVCVSVFPRSNTNKFHSMELEKLTTTCWCKEIRIFPIATQTIKCGRRISHSLVSPSWQSLAIVLSHFIDSIKSKEFIFVHGSQLNSANQNAKISHTADSCGACKQKSITIDDKPIHVVSWLIFFSFKFSKGKEFNQVK